MFDSSPGLIAAYRVLHRLITPRHPPYTLSSLITFITGPVRMRRTDPRQTRPAADGKPPAEQVKPPKRSFARARRGRFARDFSVNLPQCANPMKLSKSLTNSLPTLSVGAIYRQSSWAAQAHRS